MPSRSKLLERFFFSVPTPSNVQMLSFLFFFFFQFAARRGESKHSAVAPFIFPSPALHARPSLGLAVGETRLITARGRLSSRPSPIRLLCPNTKGKKALKCWRFIFPETSHNPGATGGHLFPPTLSRGPFQRGRWIFAPHPGESARLRADSIYSAIGSQFNATAGKLLVPFVSFSSRAEQDG